MEHLWSPWRMAYIQTHKKDDACAFCVEMERQDGPANLIIHRSRRAFVILNRYPYTSGHLMVVPYQHVPALDDLEPETRAEMMELVNRAIQVLERVYRAQGFNIGLNLGIAAGAGITEHVHIHVVPRWGGDTNFMSALAHTRVLPEDLPETYRRVAQGWRDSDQVRS